ncbi:MAG: Hsp20/alpha crystallin family protein [Cytophagales bacterium]|nr:MAG: Hsp20/alpha crystallin family protein [Cytophagales bacterium]
MQYNKGFQGEYKGGCGSWGGHHKSHWGKGKWGEMWKQKMAHFNQPPVNIEDTDSAFVISLYAAGLDKSKVSLTVKEDVLTIAYPGTQSQEGATEQPQTGFTYQEYSFNAGGFERQFQLNNKVLTDQISATYADGILRVTLPKNPATNVPAQTIAVG